MAKMFLAKTDYCFTVLSEIKEMHTDCIIHSDDKSTAVHSAVIRNCSEFMSRLFASNKYQTIIIPGFSPVLKHFVTLVYTGSVNNLSEENTELLRMLCKLMGMKTHYERMCDITNRAKEFQDSDCLKIEADFFCQDSDHAFHLRFPKSRMDLRKRNEPFLHQKFEGFRVQEEYNCSPVGPYKGPYDQNPDIPLFAQLSVSKLNYQKYTSFSHPDTSQCKKFEIKSTFDKIGDLEKIEALDILEEATEAFVDPENDEHVFYTCQNKFCVIPCPCNLCNLEDGQCPEHTIKHRDLFDETEHAISVRSVHKFCSKENFFWHSYILKYSGIPKNCFRCSEDLLHHKCYHLKFHWMCKFCKLYQYKLYPKTVDELHAREKKEENWYKSVCPYCDKKFSGPYRTKKHIEFEHKNKKFKCEKCPKAFHSQASLEYHKLTNHITETPPFEHCSICDKDFLSKVSLKNHMKVMHNDVHQIECNQCELKFKQRQYLNAHILHVHGLNQRKEDYWQDLPKESFKYEMCVAKFKRKADLKSHMNNKHSAKKIIECDLCPAKFKWSKNFQRHKLQTHGPEENKIKCPDCEKMFSRRSNMERHLLSHENN